MSELLTKNASEIIDSFMMFAAFIAAIVAVHKTMVKPIKEIGKKTTVALEAINVLSDDVADMMGDRLHQAHTYYTNKGSCSKFDKERLLSMHKRYTEMNRNHLVESYAEDLLKLPEK